LAVTYYLLPTTFVPSAMNSYEFDPNNCPLYDINSLKITPLVDNFCLDLGKYLADGLNCYFSKYDIDSLAVKDIIAYDAVNVDLSRFPILKVFRLKDRFSSSGNQGQGVIYYCLSYPDLDLLPGLISWVSAVINELLKSFSSQHENCDRSIKEEIRDHEYRLMVNAAGEPVWAFLRINFTFMEI